MKPSSTGEGLKRLKASTAHASIGAIRRVAPTFGTKVALFQADPQLIAENTKGFICEGLLV